MVAAVHDPRGEAGDAELPGLERALVQAQARDGAEVLVEVVGDPLAAEARGEVLRHELALAHGVLRVGHAEAADAAAREVGGGRHVAGAPGVRDDAVVALDTTVGAHAQAPALLDREVGVLEHRAGHDARGPDDDVGLERLARRQLDDAADGRLELRVQVHERAAFGEVLQHPVAGLERHLGHDAAHRLDEVEVRVLEVDLGVLLHEVGRDAAHLGEDLDAREAAADHHEGEEALALGAGGQRGRAVEVGEDAVADGDGLLDRLQADGLVRDARDRERARDAARGDDDDVVRELVGLAHGRRDGRGLRRVVDAGDLRRDDVGGAEVAALRDDRVAGLDGSGDHLGQERLVRHVRQRVDHGDLGLAGSEVRLELPCRVETGVAAADDQDFGHDG